MRKPITTTVPDLPGPTLAERAAATGKTAKADHDAFMAAWPCLNAIEHRDVAGEAPTHLTVAAWNIERCKWVEPSAARLAALGADIVLATEMDRGMARSGQRHTTRDLAEQLSMGHIFGVEFVELALGDRFETAAAEGQSNADGLHGNAILSRWPLRRPALLPLDDGGLWFGTTPKGDTQSRVGGRNAMAAQIDTAAGPLTLVSVHYESESTPESRADQTRRMLEQISELYGDGACVIGGDLNTATLSTEVPDRLADAATTEPAFTVFAEAGFSWTTANSGATTTRQNPRPPAEPAPAPHA